MPAPWTNKTGLARLIAISASTLGIATGLCGLNFVGVMSFGGGTHKSVMNFLAYAAYAELLIMLISLAALIVLALLSLVRSLLHKD